MRKLSLPTLLLWLLAFTFTACKKDAETPDYAAIDAGIIDKFLTDNNITTGQRQASGLVYIPVVSNPTGLKATVGKIVRVRYTGTLLDGTIFDATSRRNDRPLNFTLGVDPVISGFAQGVSLMRKGEKSVLLIPSGLAYGTQGSTSGTIPPNTVIRFEVELVDVLDNYGPIDEELITEYIAADTSIHNAQRQPNGLYYVPKVVNPTGTPATAGKRVFVNYKGTFINYPTLTAFDSSPAGKPFDFVLGQGNVIQGWDQGIALMRKGEKSILLIPSALAYGKQGAANVIPPNTVLRFEVELVDVQ